MNRLVIIGNGFDMAHGLKTSYMDFINWYWNQRINSFIDYTTPVYKDDLCTLSIKNVYSNRNVISFMKSISIELQQRKISGAEVIKRIKESPEISFSCTPLFNTILQSIEAKGWVDIENDYYQLLKKSLDTPTLYRSIKDLNSQFAFLQEKLVEYLRTVETTECKYALGCEIIDNFNPADFSTEGRQKALDNIGLDFADCMKFRHNSEVLNKSFPGRPKHIMLLSFNYTSTVDKYENNNTITCNYIHGRLDQPENIIFGYGDELDKDYQDILDRNNNELLRNIKSVKYLETRRYHDLLEFLMSDPFQVLIMGHSCGNSDRTLLNTVFEHENCISIKPYYHKWDNGSDNYMELVQNISRNFTNMKLFRDRVVNKEQCKTM